MKLFIAIVISLVFSSSYAQCYGKLTKGYQDSALFTQHTSYVYSNPSESLDEKMAYNAINKTLKDLECKERISLNKVECADVLRTQLCRVDVVYGYFLVVKDYVDTVNILFNRWD